MIFNKKSYLKQFNRYFEPVTFSDWLCTKEFAVQSEIFKHDANNTAYTIYTFTQKSFVVFENKFSPVSS